MEPWGNERIKKQDVFQGHERKVPDRRKQFRRKEDRIADLVLKLTIAGAGALAYFVYSSFSKFF
jgi:hypothetical protein